MWTNANKCILYCGMGFSARWSPIPGCLKKTYCIDGDKRTIVEHHEVQVNRFKQQENI